MNSQTKAVLIFLVVGFIALGVLYKVVPIFREKNEIATSDAEGVRGKIKIAIDDWIGYYPISSLKMKKDLRNQGLVLEVKNDGGDYPTRMNKLENGEIDFAVVTVDSYILNGAAVKYPGTIIAVLDESKGGDAVVAYSDKIKNLDSFKKYDKDAKDFPKIAFTPGSPSHHLIKAIGSHFGVSALKDLLPERKIETKDAQEALRLLKEKKVSVAVLWEPNVSRALEIPGVIKILGTENTSRLIVDILVVNRNFSAKNPEFVDIFLKTYFRTLKFYTDNTDILKKDIVSERKDAGNEKSVSEMLNGVSFTNLTENCFEWFGINIPGQNTEQGLVDTMYSTINILVENKDFRESPLPDKDPYRIKNSKFLEDIYKKGIQNGFTNVAGQNSAVVDVGTGLDRKFKPLSEEGWKKLRSVGNIKVEPIKFQSGSSDLSIEEKEKLDGMVGRLKHYPMFRILVGGHTSLLGDKEANKNLSKERAESVTRYLNITYNIDQNRIKAVGFGGDEPLLREPNESDRAYNYRLPRVEISLLSESF